MKDIAKKARDGADFIDLTGMYSDTRDSGAYFKHGELAAGLASGRTHHVEAGGQGELDGGDADRAARSVYEHLLSRPGPAALEELVSHDSSLVVGILGGSSGTTYDAFKLIAEAQKYGARAATFGRKIKNAEDPLTFVEMLRHIVDGDLTPKQAVKSYHSALQSMKLKPWRSLEDDLQLTDKNLKYLK